MADVSRLNIREHVALRELTTFRIGGAARYFAEVSSAADLLSAFSLAEEMNLSVFLMGGGSNLLISDEGFPGLVCLMRSRGIEMLSEDDSSVVLRVAAGERWDELVAYAVQKNVWGIENMSLIPGTVGAVPIQNVGAYGQDASQVVCAVEVIDRATKEMRILSSEQCGFSYRKSIFNGEQKGRYVVWYVLFRLRKDGFPNRTHQAVRSLTSDHAGIKQMRSVVIQLREDGRLPDMEISGNAGSFFQSPLILKEQMSDFVRRLKQRLPAEKVEELLLRCYETKEEIKIPAAGLIRIADMEGATVGGAALYPGNPTVLINRTGNARAADVLELARRVRQAVFDVSELELPVEPELVGFDKLELKRYIARLNR